jgi:carbon-monoxide dehydrogenase medium subunit
MIEADEGGVVVGAMVSQRRAELDPTLGARCPLIADALSHVAHPQIRSRGTIGGSIAHADAASELPAALLALDGHVRTHGPAGERRIAAADFFQGMLTTALAEDEVLTAVEFPAAGPASGSACVEIARRTGDYALAGAVAQVTVADGAVAAARLAFFGVSDRPVRASAAEQAALGKGVEEAPAAAATVAAEPIKFTTDPQLTEDYRRQLVGVVARRALQRALERAR